MTDLWQKSKKRRTWSRWICGEHRQAAGACWRLKQQSRRGLTDGFANVPKSASHGIGKVVELATRGFNPATSPTTRA